MKHRYSLAASTALTVALLCGCQPSTTVNTGDGQVFNILGKTLTIQVHGLPSAEISEAGDFSIDGKPVAVTEAQRALLAAYYKELNGIGAAGAATGKEGAALAGKAMGAAITGVLTGNPDDIGAKVEAETKKVEAAAMKICDRLANLQRVQEALAAQLPAFAPYGSITLGDVSDCRS
jgi:hypothetical protein